MGAMLGVEFTRVPTLPFIVAAMNGEIGHRAVDRCFDAVGVGREIACAPGAVLPMRDLFGLFEWFARARGDPMFGVFVGNSLKPEAFGLFIRYAMQAPDFGATIRRVIRGLHLHQTCSVMALDVDADIASWSYRVTLPLTFGREHHGVHVVVQMIEAAGRFLGFPLPIIDIGFEAERPRHHATIEDRYQVPVRWRQPTNAIRFPARLLAVPQRTILAEAPTTFSDLIRYARNAVPRTASEKATAALRTRLADGRSSAESVAEYLNLGVRTMQRQLAAEGIAFSALREHVRRDRARELVSGSDMPLWRVAEILGYSDAAHFTRAFRRWSGQTPSELRASAQRTA